MKLRISAGDNEVVLHSNMFTIYLDDETWPFSVMVSVTNQNSHGRISQPWFGAYADGECLIQGNLFNVIRKEGTS